MIRSSILKINAKISMKKPRFKRLKLILVIAICGIIISKEINSNAKMPDSKKWEKYIQHELYEFGKKVNQFSSNVSVSCDHFVANFSCTIYYDQNNKNPISTDMETRIISNMFENKFRNLLLHIKEKSGENTTKNLVVYSMPSDKIKKAQSEPKISSGHQKMPEVLKETI